MPDPRNVCVFCGSSSGEDPRYADLARTLGVTLAERGVGLVYGGASVGLMGTVANSAMATGGHVVGVMPRNLMDREIGHHGLSELVIVETMHQRKQRMYELADGFVALPGGLGTLEELFEAATWNPLGLHGPVSKPLVMLDVADYWRPLAHFLDETVARGFVRPQWRDLIGYATDPDGALAFLAGAALR